MERRSEGSITITERKLLDSIPSGSGIVLKNGVAYVIGDDATGVYVLNVDDYTQRKIPITAFDQSLYREAKSVKRDFESSAIVTWYGTEYLLAFGSGSSSPLRDSLLVVRTSDPADNRIISLQKFYKHLQEVTLSNAGAWNLEGATVTNDLLILFNRAGNIVIRISANDFLSHILGGESVVPAIEFERVKLPMIGDHEARLSGACTLNNDLIIFCASVEDTPDWIQDGPVLGSVIGIYSLQKKSVLASFLLKDANGVIVKEKIESLDISGKPAKDEISLVAIADNDNGTSILYKLALLIPPGLELK